MKFAKLAFSLAVLVLYLCVGWAAWAAWNALPWWGFGLTLMFVLPPATWLFYIGGTNVIRADKLGKLPELSALLRLLLSPMAATFNFLNNTLPMTIMFLDLPREFATTMRLDRYVEGPDSWRKSLALQVREQLLNVFDYRGVHT